jgi:hypothetical protein
MFAEVKSVARYHIGNRPPGGAARLPAFFSRTEGSSCFSTRQNEKFVTWQHLQQPVNLCNSSHLTAGHKHFVTLHKYDVIDNGLMPVATRLFAKRAAHNYVYR